MTAMGRMLRVTMAVEEGYRGVSAKTVEVYTASSSAACGYAFKEGERYLVYASTDEDSRLLVSLCSATKPAVYADEDLAYLRSFPSLSPKGKILGRAWRYTHDPSFKPKFQPSIMDHYRPPEQEYTAMSPEAEMKITAQTQDNRDGKKYVTLVGSDGNWLLPDLHRAITTSFLNIQTGRTSIRFFRR